MYDVAVVGAGPTGSAAARFCAEKGLNTICIEEHAAIGYPVQCAGLLSNTAFGACDVSGRAVLNEVCGASIISSGGDSLTFRSDSTKAYVVDRSILDQEMAKNAADAGAEFLLKTYACSYSGGNLVTRGRRGKGGIRCRMVIAADGPRSVIARSLGMELQKEFLSGIQAEIPAEAETDIVNIYPDASPDFFGWKIPAGKGRLRVGLCGEDDVLERFIRFAGGADSPCLHLITGTIPLGVMPRTYGHRVLFAGDAAGFPKPTSGGGVYTGVRSAMHAASVAEMCCISGDFSDDALSSYETMWKEDFGREIASGMTLLKLRRTLSNDDIAKLIRALNDPEIMDLIVKHGDIDRPANLARILLKKPKIATTLGIQFCRSVLIMMKNL